MNMLKQLKSGIMRKFSGTAPSGEAPKGPGQGAEADLETAAEQLHEIAGELDVVIIALENIAFSDDEAFGVSLILRRQTNRIRRLGAGMWACG